ncbi:diaminopimelate decarboxylase family protein [Streptosporangium sp. NPDC049376]|uniref:diaminopimelate decarboxylase family protein n=1 Tax=Streptosporangium sp. NPDC049376 TaxID=3366192 RepID=UPI0037A39490
MPAVGDGITADDSLAALALERGTPLYVLGLTSLRERVREMSDRLTWPRGRLYFATMANDHPAVLTELAGLGLGACVNSMPHALLALDSGFRPADVQFTSTGTTAEDMRELLTLGIPVNADSLGQLWQWGEVGGRRAGLRVNAASLGGGAPRDRIGVEADQVMEVVAAAMDHGVDVTGLHVYTGTNHPCAAAMLPTLDALFALAAAVPHLEYVNVGGGIGVDYAHNGVLFDLESLGERIRDCHRRLEAAVARDIMVVMEPGRAMTGPCGRFVTAVTDVKTLAGVRYVAVDSSVAMFPRPLQHPESPHRIRILRRSTPVGPDERMSQAVVVGRTTYSRDVLGQTELPDDVRVGDLLVFDDAGAYCQSMASRFLGQREPSFVLG